MSGLDSGTTIGSYQVVRLIAEGALADVYEVAHRRRGGRFVAKLLRADLGVNQVALDRFRREVELVSGLRHPHIAAVHEAGVTADGRSFVVSEFLAGVSLAERIAEAAPMSIMEVLDIVEAVVGALAAAEAAGVLHRNLTPRNIMLVPFATPGGEPRQVVKVLDFGVSTVREFRSRSLHDPGLAGAGGYLSPEQARGRLGEVDHRSDQFSLAAISYEMMSGRPAFSADTAALVLVKVARVDPKRLVDLNPGVPDEMAAAIHRGLCKVKEDRFPSALEFLRALCRPVLGLRPAPRLVLSAEDEAGDAALRPVGDLAETVEVPAPVFTGAAVEERPVVKVASAAVAPAPARAMTGEIIVRREATDKPAPVIEVVDHSPGIAPKRRKTGKARGESITARPVNEVPTWVVATPDAEEIFAPARRSRGPALGMTALMVAGAAAAGWALYGEGGIISGSRPLLPTASAPTTTSIRASAPAPLPPVAVERVGQPSLPTLPTPPGAAPGVISTPASAAATPAPAPSATVASPSLDERPPSASSSSTSSSTSRSTPTASPSAAMPTAAKPVRRAAPRPRPVPPVEEETEAPATAVPEAPTPPTPPIPPSELLAAPASPVESAPAAAAGEPSAFAPAATPSSEISPAAPTAPTPPTAPTAGGPAAGTTPERPPSAVPDESAPKPPASVPEPRPSEPPAAPEPAPPQVPPAAPPSVPSPTTPS